MKCAVCKGACCEEFAIPNVPVSTDEDRWLRHHATIRGRWLFFDAACKQLVDGRCSIYRDRPLLCKRYPPGGDDCLNVVLRRRTPEEYACIRGGNDPVRIHPPSKERGAPVAAGAPMAEA